MKVRLKTLMAGPDGLVIQAWETHAEAWASIEPLVGKEYFATGREHADVTHRIRMRYLAGIDYTMRVAWGSRVFEIEAVLNVGKRSRELILMCRESV